MLSIIIPTLNEARALPATLAALSDAEEGATGVKVQVLVVDGGSTDATRALAGQYPRVQIIRSLPGRAVQLNAGAAAAHGSTLVFLHADTLLPPDGLAQICNARTPFGGFQQAFSGRRWDLRFISWLHNWRCGRTGVFYGDQAMFVQRQLFEAVGGFPAVDELEDIKLSERLLARAEPTFLAQHVVTDSRKFEQLGVWRSLYYCLLILVCYELRVPLRGRAFFAPIR